MSLRDDIGEAEKEDRYQKLLLYRDELKNDVIDAYRHVRTWEKTLNKRTSELERVEQLIRERILEKESIPVEKKQE